MSEFKKGQTVRCVGAGLFEDCFTVGRLYVVAHPNTGCDPTVVDDQGDLNAHGIFEVVAATDTPSSDAVHQPAHYARFVIEPITFINANGITYNRGNAIKYISRAGAKDPAKEIEDLNKAIRYLEIEKETLARQARVAAGEKASDVWSAML